VDKLPPPATSVIRLGVCSYSTAPSVVVIAQKWPCWLFTALALGLPVIGGFFSSRYHSYFPIPDEGKLKSWSTVEELSAWFKQAPAEAVVLASGSLNFLVGLQHMAPARFLFAVDVYFPRVGLRDSERHYRSTATRLIREGYMSAILRHADFGGATNAVHLVVSKGFDIVFARPSSRIPRVIKHHVQTAARGGFPEIDPPCPLPSDAAHAPLVLEGLGRVDGLYDVTHPALEYAVPCVFKASGWVRRRLTAKEWLTVHDVPLSLISQLEVDTTARNAIALSMSSLIIGHLIQTLWGVAGGGRNQGREAFGRGSSDDSSRPTTRGSQGHR
jgi:hypothetical protein